MPVTFSRDINDNSKKNLRGKDSSDKPIRMKSFCQVLEVGPSKSVFGRLSPGPGLVQTAAACQQLKSISSPRHWPPLCY